MMSSKEREMIVFFSDFLTDLNTVVANIKQCVYDLVKVSINIPKISVVYRSMPSIVFSAHRTFDDLKQVQSIISGVVRAHNLHNTKPMFNTVSHRYNRCRSQSEETQIFRFPIHLFKEKTNRLSCSTSEKSVSETVKMGQRPKQIIKEQLVRINDFEDQTLLKIKRENDRYVVPEPSQQGKCSQLQSEQKPKKKLSVLQLRIQQRLKNLIHNNKQTLSNVRLKNQACLKLINSAKIQINATF